MMLRLCGLLLAGVVAWTGVLLAEDPPGGGEPPVRLKKKGKTNAEENPKPDPATVFKQRIVKRPRAGPNAVRA